MAVLMSVASPGSLCCYHNKTKQIHSIRIVDGFKIQLERIVFPKQKFLFEAPMESDLEITTSKAGGLHVERVPCQKLQVLTSI